MRAIEQVKIYAKSLGLEAQLSFRCSKCAGSRWTTDMDGRYCRGSDSGRPCSFQFTGDEHFTVLTVC